MLFINENYINSLLEDESLFDPSCQREIIIKSREAKGLTVREAAALLNINSPELYDELLYAAKEVKEKVYGNRLVLFAPIYISNKCANNCKYCSYRKNNDEVARKSLSINEIITEAQFLIEEGHKSVLLVAGIQSKKMSVLREAIEAIYSLNFQGKSIKSINLKAAPLSFENFMELRSSQIAAYHSFIETYDFNSFKEMYPGSAKSEYSWNLYTPDRALQAGLEDVGIGVLFGLSDYKFETLALLMHALDLDNKYGIGPHTITIPRIQSLPETVSNFNPIHSVDDFAFKKLIATIRLTIPYTGIIVSKRERAEFRKELFEVGVSQISAGGRIAPKFYDETKQNVIGHIREQSGDNRCLDEIVREISDLGYIPSFCTSCFKSKRSGNLFMELAKNGDIKKFCIPNALSSLEEYLNDNASKETNLSGKNLIELEMKFLDPKLKSKAEMMISKVDQGAKDILI